jgi:putative transposase
VARLPRLEWPGQLHYLVLRGHGALAGPGVFTDTDDRLAFVDALRQAACAEAVHVHAYALLHDEAQLLVTPRETGALGRLMQAVGRRYVSAYNRRHHHRGSLWAGRYHCAVLEPGELRLAALRLVDGAIGEPGATSAGSRTGAPRETWLVDPPEVWALGNTPFEREAAYRALLARGVDPDQAQHLRRAALGGWALGTAAFLAAAARATARPAQPRPRGRPRKAA